MKELTDFDIADMIGQEFQVDDVATRNSVRKSLHLSTRIPQQKITPKHATLDFHEHTEQEAWEMLENLVMSGTQSATVITGASGILKIKFQQWANDSVLSHFIISCIPINNGSFSIKIRKNKNYL